MHRYSRNREAILECLRGTKSHPSAEWIYEKLKDEYPALNLATVYRNLSHLKEDGLIRSMGVVAGEEHFDGNVESHSHVVCVKCGAVADLDEGKDKELLESVKLDAQNSTGFEIPEATIVLRGLCPECSSGAAKSDTL